MSGDMDLTQLIDPLVKGNLGNNYSSAEVAQAILDSHWFAAAIAEAKAGAWEECLEFVTRNAQVGSAGLSDECYVNPYRADHIEF